jgi:hypothetical protein
MFRKLGLILFILFTVQLNCCAQTPITFLYLNGSNTNNKSTYEWYVKGIKKLHPMMKKYFEENETIQKEFLKNGQYEIEMQPSIFYWGDKSAESLEFVKNNLNLTKRSSPWFAYKVRELIATCMHDAIWVQKPQNMAIVLTDLHEQVKKETDKGNQVVLFGYSAGSFVTAEYLLRRITYINVKDYFEHIGVRIMSTRISPIIS